MHDDLTFLNQDLSLPQKMKKDTFRSKQGMADDILFGFLFQFL